MKTVKRSHYDVLGVEPVASAREIRTSFLMRMRVLHPDRFDPKIQPREWEQANQMLAELNQAYTVLKDPDKRAKYDLELGLHIKADGKQSSTDREGGNETDRRTQSTSARERKAQSTTRTSRPRSVATYRKVVELPAAVQEKLVARQAAKSGDQFKVKTGNLFYEFGACAAAAIWLAVLADTCNSLRWGPDQATWNGLLTVVSCVVFCWAIGRINRWRKAKLTPHIYFTPLYFVKTGLDDLRFWWLWSLKNYDVTHHHQNGSYRYTKLIFHFEDGDVPFTLYGKDKVKTLFDNLARWEAEYKKALSQNNMEYFLARDDFIGIAEQKDAESVSTGNAQGGLNLKLKRGLNYGIAAACGAAIFVGAFNLNLYYDDKRSWQSAQLFNEASAFRKYLESHPAGRWRTEATSSLASLYDAATNRYLDSRPSKFDSEASDAVVALLHYTQRPPRTTESRSHSCGTIKSRVMWSND
jgi:DnaJ-domain-containing protein 1